MSLQESPPTSVFSPRWGGAPEGLTFPTAPPRGSAKSHKRSAAQIRCQPPTQQHQPHLLLFRIPTISTWQQGVYAHLAATCTAQLCFSWRLLTSSITLMMRKVDEESRFVLAGHCSSLARSSVEAGKPEVDPSATALSSRVELLDVNGTSTSHLGVCTSKHHTQTNANQLSKRANRQYGEFCVWSS